MKIPTLWKSEHQARAEQSRYMKTLKDFERREMPADRTTWSVPFVLSEELRAEAIKWVKKLQNKKDNYKPNDCSMDWQIQVWTKQQDILEEFFNITEADLK